MPASKYTQVLIDDDLKSLIPPLAIEERAGLEASILAEGIRDPLVLWGDILIDGHNRYAIATEHDIPFETVQREFDDIEHAQLWMISNQYARRNLNDYQRGMLALKKKPILAAIAEADRIAKQNIAKGHAGTDALVDAALAVIDGAKGHAGDDDLRPSILTDAKPETRDKLAEEASISTGTFSAIETIDKKAAPEIKEVLTDGLMSINSGKEAAKLAPDEQVKVAEKVKGGATGSEAIKTVKRARKEEIREETREVNRAKVAAAPDPTKIEGAYNTIVIDPPWDWGDEGDGDQLGRAKPDYATLTIEQITALPVNNLADENCHLYLWITNRSLPKGFGLMEAFGFRYITCITWVKPHFGMGNYFRGQTEQILFGVKGSQQLLRKNAPTVFNSARGTGGHSSKPQSFYSFVESCSPGPYLEMFSRSNQEGWVSWGE